jgi:hypothetical protein
MIASNHFLVIAAFLWTATPAFAQSGSTANEREDNRRKLERVKDQPDEWARIRKKALYFLSLPEDQRAYLIDLDQKLHKEPMPSRKRLEKAMERYAAWLKGLDSAQRKMIQDATDAKTRLEIVKKIRAEEWLKQQPSAVQRELAKLDNAKRAEQIQTLRNQERKQKNLWIISSRFWDDLSKGRTMPARLSDFDGEVNVFFNEYLSPRLDRKEKDKLKAAEGQWPHFPMTLVALADRHPPALPDPRWPMKFDDLPRDVKKRIFKVKGGGAPQKFMATAKREGFAKAASIWTMRKGPPLLHELFAHNLSCMYEPVKQFVAKKLLPELSREELVAWNSAEGWPKFPLTLKQLADDRDLQVPWHTLPGNPELWDKYRLIQRLAK